ncbi:uncharacterized protein LOC132748976 [Ruditapes philippinarum]|uniref:uncharacterized protein LOC132748976 n=1 Tax=Ruditapes philippinarum TaxID=129788 RepID=UPI00295AAA21|nr:uncharacterized protein LOC132748976 [Ruditapes philippinarum]
MANIVGLVGIGVSGVALLFAIVALASDKWETITVKGLTSEFKVGLWEMCTTDGGTTTCVDFEDVDNSIVKEKHKTSADGCKAMIFLAIFTTTGAIVSAVLVMFVMKEQQILFFAAGGLNLASGLFLMIAMALYVDKIQLLNFRDLEGVFSYLDNGFYLDIGAWLAAWIAGGFFIAAKCLTKNKVNSS